MSYVSPRSLQLLHDIVSEGENNDYDDLYIEQTAQSEADDTIRVENMNGETQQETLNLFEKLQQENGPVQVNGEGLVNGYTNGHVENGIEEDTLHGIPEESEEESYTVTEDISETTQDTSTVETSSSYVITKKYKHARKINNNKLDHNHNQRRPTKTSSVRDTSTDGDSMSDQVETMSDSGRVGRRQRKLNKRAQYREFRPIGMEPLETAEERLEKKYMELEELISGQFVEQKKALSVNHLQQMELLRQQYAIASHGLPPSGVLIPRSLPSHHRSNLHNRQAGRDKENHGNTASDDEAYGTIRTLQVSKSSQRRSRAKSARTRPLSATRHNQSRSTSRERRDRTPDNNAQSGDERSKARSRSNSGSRSSSRSPRRPATETFLKNTDKEFVREWIKRKDMEYRRQKREERKRKKLERKEKIEKRLEREEKFKDSHIIVNAWMKQKQKEVARLQRQQRRELKNELKQKEQNRTHGVSGIHCWGVDRPVSAPGPILKDRNKIRVQRPGTTASEVRVKEESKKASQTTLENGDNSTHTEVPQPPQTNYVYRRPVLGKVRLRNKQSQEEVKQTPVKKPVEKPLSKDEIEKKQRISYDDWLQQKRKVDQEKKKEMQKKKELAQSNPEYEVPVPDLVQNSRNNVLRGKRIPGSSAKSSGRPEYVSKIISQEERDRIREMARRKQHFNRSIQYEIDTTYDERFESEEEAMQRVAKNVVNYVMRGLAEEEEDENLYEDTDEVEHEGLANLSVLGSRAPLSSRNRPMSASALGIPCPQSSKSPRRPVSAQPRKKQPSSEVVVGGLPFPSDIGGPPQVLRVQKKLFTDRTWSNPEEEDRPDPQGSDSTNNKEEEERSTSQEVLDPETKEAEDRKAEEEEEREEEEKIRENKKRVSFCEQTIVFDDVEFSSQVYEELDNWNDAAGDDGEFDMEKVRKMFIEGSLELNKESETQESETQEEEVEEETQEEEIQEELQETAGEEPSPESEEGNTEQTPV